VYVWFPRARWLLLWPEKAGSGSFIKHEYRKTGFRGRPGKTLRAWDYHRSDLFKPSTSGKDALELMEHYHISGVPITVDGKLVGIITNRDIRFEDNMMRPISE